MSFRVARLVSLLLLSALVATAGAASAQGRGNGHAPPAPPAGNGAGQGGRQQVGGNAPRQHDRRQDHRELSDAVRRVERRTGGQVLSAERVPFDGRDVNRVKVIDSSGRVRVYMDDPAPRAPRPADSSEPPNGREN